MKRERGAALPAGDSSVLAERELIKKAKAGDNAAFRQLVDAYSKRIYNIGLKMLGNSEDAADMTQETLLKIYRNLGGFRGDSAFSTWVYRISVNTCRDALRAVYRRHERVFSGFGEEEAEDGFPEVADYSALPEIIYIEGEEMRYLQRLIDGLTPKYRLVVTLRELSGLSYQEIADAAGISVGTVKSRLNRARAVMRSQAEQDAEQFPQLLRLMGKEGGARA